MGITALVGLLASILVGLKNSSGQPLVPAAISAIIGDGEAVVTSIIADIQAAGAAGATSQSAVAAYLQTVQVLLTALQSEKVLSAATVSQITALTTALAAALAAEQAAQAATNPGTLTPIPPAM